MENRSEYLPCRTCQRVFDMRILMIFQSDKDPNTREYYPQHILREHAYHVGCVAWSPNDSILLTASESTIKMWNARVSYRRNSLLCYSKTFRSQTGVCMHVLDVHDDVVTGLAWLPDGMGFISAGLDRKIILWVIWFPGTWFFRF